MKNVLETTERRGTHRIVLASGCLVVALLAGAHLDQPFLDGHLGYAGALRGVIGENYLRQDLAATRLAPLQNAGPTFGDPPSVRFNHPPLAGMLVGLSFGAFGPSPAAARLVPLVASVLTIPFLFGWMRRLFGEGPALAAIIFWCLSPFVAIYGAMPSYEPLVLLAWNVLLWSWARARLGEGPAASTALAAAAIAFGVWTDWAMIPLAAGLAAVEVVHVVSERPRRPWLAATLVAGLVVSVGALACYYLVVLDIDGGRLEALYRFRAGMGRWALTEVAAHIAHRSAVLLTWPVVAIGLVGLTGILTGRGALPRTALRHGRAFVLAGLIAPAVSLLVFLPQHAVIHCFSAWYLLPGAVLCASVGTTMAGRWVETTAGQRPAALLSAVACGVLVWQAAPVVADGWISDGSPLEGRPRLAYRHLVVAEWAQANTEPGEILVVDPATGVTGVRAWFHHGRPERRLRRGRAPEETLGSGGFGLALLETAGTGTTMTRNLLAEHGGSLVDGILAIRPGRGSPIEVLELVEESPPTHWPLLRSASIPPHRLDRAPAREAVYAAQLRNEPLPAQIPDGPQSLAELSARHLAALERGDGGVAEARARELLEALQVRTNAPLCNGLEWIGVTVEPSQGGMTRVGVLLRAAEELDRLPRIGAALVGPGRSSFRLAPDDAFRWPEGAYVSCSHTIDEALPPGAYVVELSGCRRRERSPAITLEPRTMLPAHPRVGRL